MKAVVTGAAGFAGSHLVRHLLDMGHDVVGVGRAHVTELDFEYVALELADSAAVERELRRIGGDWVFHLAAAASVPASWRDPAATLQNNVATTLNVLQSAGEARVLIAGSGEIYGPPAQLPVTEDHSLKPQNPYAVSKLAADLLGACYADARGTHVIRTRAFNHFGPGQSDLYVVAAFARQIADAERRGAESVVVKTGELRSHRDFTDVRDVVRAYVALIGSAPPGAYNVCSGTSRSAADILAALAQESPLEVVHEVDPQRLRKNEVMDIHGSHDRLTEATGWQPVVPFKQTIADTLEWWRSQ